MREQVFCVCTTQFGTVRLKQSVNVHICRPNTESKQSERVVLRLRYGIYDGKPKVVLAFSPLRKVVERTQPFEPLISRKESSASAALS